MEVFAQPAEHCRDHPIFQLAVHTEQMVCPGNFNVSSQAGVGAVYVLRERAAVRVTHDRIGSAAQNQNRHADLLPGLAKV